MEINEKVYRPEGEEGRCPKCGNANALLHNVKESGYYEQIDSRIEVYECRDCGYKTIDPVFISKAPVMVEVYEDGYTTATFYFGPLWRLGIKGCPLGSGRSEEAAVRDLLVRTNRESGTGFNQGNINIIYR